MLCAKCGGTKMKNLRAGVNRVREELEALAREPVAELTAERGTDAGGTGTRIVVGTEAALHRIHKADVVAFLDFDQELLAPRYRAVVVEFSCKLASLNTKYFKEHCWQSQHASLMPNESAVSCSATRLRKRWR